MIIIIAVIIAIIVKYSVTYLQVQQQEFYWTRIQLNGILPMTPESY
jgi:hypothetical protein